MLKIKISSLLVMLMVLLQCNYGLGFLKQANAMPISDNIIDSVTMAVYDTAGQTVTDNVYEQGSKVQLNYTWSLPDNSYQAGDQFTFSLPQAFKLFNNISGLLLNDADNVGTFTVDAATHQVEMTFNDYVETHVNVHGTLTFNTQFDKTQITGSTTQTIVIPIRTGNQIFTIHFKPDVTSTIEKSGVAEGFNAKSINWTVDVNKVLDSVQNAVVTDPMPAGLDIPVTVAVYGLNVNLDGTVSQGSLVDSSKYIVDTTGNVLKVSFTDSPIDTAYRIQYVTPITDGTSATFTNTASFEGSNKQPAVQASATVAVQRGSDINKTVVSYDSSTQTIDWAIKYNYKENSIAQPFAYFTDLFDNSQSLVPGSVHVFPVTLDASSGVETLGSEVTGLLYTEAAISDTGKNGFRLQFNNDISSAYLIKYQTKANNRVIFDANIHNSVTSGSGASSSATQHINQVVLVKSVGAVNYPAKTVNWQIGINGDKQPMRNVVLTDTFPYKGLHLIPDSLVIIEGNTPLIAGTDYTLDNSVTSEQGFKVIFTHTLTDTVIVNYTTKFNIDWISPIGSTLNFQNDVLVNWTDSNNVNKTKTNFATFLSRNEIRNNGFKSGSYNPTSKELTWSVGINYNGKTIAHPIMEDQLEAKQKLVDNSLVLYNMGLSTNGSPSKTTVVDSTYYDYSIDSNNKLMVTFNKPISSPYYVVYKTSLAGELIDSTVSNTARLFDGPVPVSKDLTAAVSIPFGGEYVSKNGVQSGDKINWTVTINRGQSTISDGKIVDTPTENQLLLPDSFHLYTTTAADHGNVTKSSELTRDTDYTLDIMTDAAGKQTFELNFLHQISTAYILEYQSLIVANDHDTVSNKVSFSGNNVTTISKETTADIIVGVSSGSGTGSGAIGSLTVTKVDAADRSLTLGGATFELYTTSDSTRTLIGTQTTDSTGIIVFQKLLNGNYIVKETVAPGGYALDSSDHPVTINSAENLSLEIGDTKLISPPGNPDTPPGNPDTPPGNPGTPPGNPGTPPGNPGTPPGNPGTPPGNPGTPPGNPGTPPGNPGTPPGNPGTPPGNPGTPPLTPPVVPPATIIEGDTAEVPLGNIPSAGPTGQKAPETIIHSDAPEVPLNNLTEQGQSGQTLPKTGESSHLPIQMAGLALTLLGSVLMRKKLFRIK